MTTKQEIDDFRSHGLWGEVDAARLTLSGIAGRTDDDRATLRRARTTVDYLGKYKAVPADLLPSDRVAQANEFAARVADIRNQVEGWDQSAAMLPPTSAAIDVACDRILAHLSNFGWLPMQRELWTAAMQNAADAYRASIEASIAQAKLDLAGIETQIRASETVLQESLDQSRKAAAAAETAKTDLEANVVAQDAAAKTQLAAAVAEIKAKGEEERAEQRKRASTHLAALQADYEAGNSLIKKIADQSVGGEYLAFAKRELWAYRIWAGLGIAGVVLAFGFLVVVFVGPLVGDWIKPTTGTDNVLLKLGISLSVAGFSVFAFREAGKRQRQSVEARYRALDVVALPPFVRDLSEAQQQQLRFLMGERLFGAPVESAADRRRKGTDNSFSLSIDPALVRELVEVVRAIK